MMIRINLLKAHEIKQGKGHNLFLQGLILGVLILLAVFFMGYRTLENEIQAYQKEKGALERQTAVFGTLQKEIKTLREKKEISQSRFNLIQNIEKERHGPVRLMEALSRILPVNQLWLTGLKENGPEIRLEGISLSNEILAQFIKRLEVSPMLNQVELVQSTQGLYKSVKVKHFTLIALIKVPPSPGEKK
jgi:type IV pilus assembly protein PilN